MIAKQLKRHRTTIEREIDRNVIDGQPYRAETAQRLADARKPKKRRKLDEDKELRTYVCAELKRGRNPKVIAGRLKQCHDLIPEVVQGKTISHESIYQWIYTGEGRFGGWYTYLPRKHRTRRKKRCRRKRGTKTAFFERISIEERPGEVETRRAPGHWETDSIQYTKQREGLSVQTERMFRLCKISRIMNRTAEETRRVLEARLGDLPQWIRKTITMDNGPEHALHHELRDPLNLQTYHCDPYASWQRGSTEHMNGLIRRFLPRKTMLATVSDDELQAIEDHLNNLPRAILNYLSPQEAFERYQSGGAFGT